MTPRFTVERTPIDFVARHTFDQAAKLKAPSLKNVPRNATEAFNSYHFSQYAPILNEDETQNMLAEVERMNRRVRVAQMINQAVAPAGLAPGAVPIPPAGLGGALAAGQAHAAAAANVGHQAVVQAGVAQAAAHQAQAAMGQAAGAPDLAQQDRDRVAALRRQLHPMMRRAAAMNLGVDGVARDLGRLMARAGVASGRQAMGVAGFAGRRAAGAALGLGQLGAGAAVGAGRMALQALAPAGQAAAAAAQSDESDDDFQMPNVPVWANGLGAQAELNRIAGDREALEAALVQIADYTERLGDADAQGIGGAAGAAERRAAMADMANWGRAIRLLRRALP